MGTQRDALDVTMTESTGGELAGCLAADEVGLVVIDGSRDPEPLVEPVEQAMNGGIRDPDIPPR